MKAEAGLEKQGYMKRTEKKINTPAFNESLIPS